jgi:SpoVK/Ycf46/Vps4 family AAA+-type ATPase
MIEEGLYDNEPSYVRATLYERVFGYPPVAGFESHDAIVNREKLGEWMTASGFEPFHFKITNMREGEERTTRFYSQSDKNAMIIIRRSYIDATKEPDRLSSDDGYESNKKTNPNKLDWFSYYGTNEEEVLKVKEMFESLQIIEESKNKLYMLKATEYGSLELDSFPTSCEGMSLELNYGSEFHKIHEHVMESLRTKKSGLYVFHGPPGTGKTSFVKYLTTVVENRKFIFVPNTMVADLFSPKLVDKLYTFKNSVLVLEDAEVCVFKRDGNNNALVAGILNITDGLLKDLLNISIIVTFNATEVLEIDTALLRKGRLKVMHKFDVLSMKDAKKLATHLGKKKTVTSPLSLADIYNLDEETGVEEAINEKRVGFGV